MNQAVQGIKAQLESIDSKLKEAQSLAQDPDMAELVAEEISSLKDQKKALENSLKTLTADYSQKENEAPESMDYANAIMEIRSGAGGDEAKIWAEDLLRMYVRFAKEKDFKLTPLDDGVIKITGKNAYATFKYESGVHRVQRVPETESSGRIHTSTASVAVLPEVKKTQVEVKEEDLDWKFTRSGGKGGQNVNKVNTAVLLTHEPTGIVINCRQERSQQQNRALALEMLRSQLWELEEEKRLKKIKSKRRQAVGRAMRAEKIRTYNYPENRVTDHRLPQTWHNLDRVLEGELDELIGALDVDSVDQTV